MLYVFGISTPASTVKTSPILTQLKLTSGIIHRVSIGFPTNCAGLAHLAVFYQERQVFPSNPDGDFAWDGALIEWDEYLPLERGLNTLAAKTWNEDDTYPHTITVRIGVLPFEVYWRTSPSVSLQQRVRAAFGLDRPPPEP